MVLVYLFIGTVKIALAIGGLEVVVKMIIYFFHERAWDRIRFGKREITPFVLWITGLPGSGKTTLANAVSEKLSKNGCKIERLDGDRVRRLFPATGFSKRERNTHIQRAGHLASMLEKHGVIVIASFISPYEETRSFVRGLCKNFVEIYMETPRHVCEQRDNKGLYEKARRGEIDHFTGVDDPYQVPRSPELTVDASEESIEDSTNKVTNYLLKRSLMP
jgi:adenylylsulfate kinase